MATLDALIAALPKVELHCHLEGSVPPEVFIELADRHGLALATRDPDHVYDFTSFLGFLDLYYLVCDAIRTPDDVALAVHASLGHGAATGNLRHREMFFSPTNHDLSYAAMVEGLTAGIEAAEVDHGVTCRMIADVNRRQSPAVAVELVEAMIAHPSPYVIGLGIDDDEDSGPPEAFAAAFTLAGDAGLHRTAHAGELGSAANVLTSLDVLGCERIDHGYAIANDPDALCQVADRGVHLTGAWFVNNFHHGTYTEGLDPATSPLAGLLRAGLPVSLNTDDPTMIPTDLNAEYGAVADTMGYGSDEIIALALAAVDAAWLDDTDRRPLRTEIEAAAATVV